MLLFMKMYTCESTSNVAFIQEITDKTEKWDEGKIICWRRVTEAQDLKCMNIFVFKIILSSNLYLLD